MNLVKHSPKRALQRRGWSGPDFFRSWFDDDLFGNFWNVNLGDLYDLNTRETEDSYLIRLEVPGYNKEEVKLEVSEGILTVRGEKKEKDEHWDLSSSFYKQFPLPEYVTIDKADANLENGILLVTIPKKAKERTKIKVNG